MPFCSERGSAASLLGLLFPARSSSRALQGGTSQHRPSSHLAETWRTDGKALHHTALLFGKSESSHWRVALSKEVKIKWVTSHSPHLHPSTQQLVEKSKEKMGEAEGPRGLWRDVCTGYHACCQPHLLATTAWLSFSKESRD